MKMKLNLLLFPVLLILCVHFNSATLFSLLGKKNYILAKPRIIIKPKIYIGTGHMLHKKKALAAKTIAIGGVVGILKKLKPKISLPKIELPRLGFPKIPLSFSVSLDKPDHSSQDHEDEVEEAAEAAADAVRNAAEEGDDDHDGHLGESKTKAHLLSSHGLHGAPSWLSEPPPGFAPFGEEYSVEESKSFRDRVKSIRSSKQRSSDPRKERNNQDDQYSRYEKEKPTQRQRRRRRPGKMEQDEDEDDDER